MLDRLPQTEPRRTLTIFGLVAALAVVVIVPLALSDGDDGVREAVEEAQEQTSTGYKPPPTTSAPTTPPHPPAGTPPPPPPPTTPAAPAEPPARPPRELRLGQTGSDDGLDYTVRSIGEVRSLLRADLFKSRGARYRPRPGRKLVRAEVTYVNRTRAAVDPFCGGGSAVLVDRDGRNHETVDDLYELDGNNAICQGSGTLRGDKSTVTLAFELKRDQEVSHLDLWNSKFSPDFDGEATRLRIRP